MYVRTLGNQATHTPYSVPSISLPLSEPQLSRTLVSITWLTTQPPRPPPFEHPSYPSDTGPLVFIPWNRLQHSGYKDVKQKDDAKIESYEKGEKKVPSHYGQIFTNLHNAIPSAEYSVRNAHSEGGGLFDVATVKYHNSLRSVTSFIAAYKDVSDSTEYGAIVGTEYN
ncbi:hypothetical protein N3K66_003110 [Trichothecium roseum]|uniref:Uncharacterized protein n=1 Tax=Trichothecium roseum TaxID=47278 RepID=A0ACC0V4S8_9HYPO|nr:hypothetical protein N3K66_003110 [Trichothecium roseum]